MISPTGLPHRLRPAVFLDRDGTLIREKSYLADPGGVEPVDGAAAAVASLQGAGFAVVVVTNQSGIARGIYSLDDYHAVAERVDELLDAEGVRVDGTYFCPHHPDTRPCDCRKPALGMYERASADLGLDPAASYFVGDKRTDVEPAITMGGQGILVQTGYGEEEASEVPPGTWIAVDLADAAARILADGPVVRDGSVG